MLDCTSWYNLHFRRIDTKNNEISGSIYCCEKNVRWATYRRIGMEHAAYKILVDENSRILGAHVLSDNASGVINMFKQGMIDGKTADDLYRDNIMSPYPSRESDIIYMLKPLLDELPPRLNAYLNSIGKAKPNDD